MNYLVAPRNYDRDFGGRTPGFGDMDEYGLPRGMSPEDKREVLDRFPLPGERGGVDTRGPSITPGSNPMDVSTEMRGLDEFKKGLDEVNRFMGIYKLLDQRGKQDALRDLLFRPTDNFDIRKPVYRPSIDKFDIQPLTPPETGKREQSYQYLEQNNEVMGPKTQMFNRFANPEDGTLNNETMARVDPIDKLLLKSLRKGEIGDPNSPRIRKAIIDLEKKIYNDGRASSMDGALMAADPKEASLQEVREINRRLIPDYDLKREKLRRGFLSPLLRGV